MRQKSILQTINTLKNRDTFGIHLYPAFANIFYPVVFLITNCSPFLKHTNHSFNAIPVKAVTNHTLGTMNFSTFFLCFIKIVNIDNTRIRNRTFKFLGEKSLSRPTKTANCNKSTPLFVLDL